MQPEVKLSKFMFHLKFSNKDNYVHEHELYEVMRSRNLYQVQFGVRSNFKKRMRNIAINEKSQKYGFENTRKLFVQRMRERREQADHLRKITALFKAKYSLDKDEGEKKLERRYVPLPATTTIYSEFPAIVPPVVSTPKANTYEDEGSGGVTNRTTTPLRNAPSPSMINSVYKDDTARMTERNEKQHNHHNNGLLTAKIMVAGRQSVETRTIRSNTSTNKSIKSNQIKITATAAVDRDKEEIGTIAGFDKKESYELHDKFNEIIGPTEVDDKQTIFEERAKTGRGKQHISTTRFADDVTDHDNDPSAKVEEWAERHGLIMGKSDVTVAKETDFKRLMIDRPSKWALGHIHRDIVDSNTLDMRYKMMLQSNKNLNNSFKKKSRQLDHLSEKLKLKTNTYISLPDLDTTPKPMVSLDPGGTTPDGRLILTKADYEDYLSGYRKARVVRLDRAKKKVKNLEKLVENFTIEPNLKLKDDTSVSSDISVQTV